MLYVIPNNLEFGLLILALPAARQMFLYVLLHRIMRTPDSKVIAAASKSKVRQSRAAAAYPGDASKILRFQTAISVDKLLLSRIFCVKRLPLAFQLYKPILLPDSVALEISTTCVSTRHHCLLPMLPFGFHCYIEFLCNIISQCV